MVHRQSLDLLSQVFPSWRLRMYLLRQPPPHVHQTSIEDRMVRYRYQPAECFSMMAKLRTPILNVSRY